MDNLLYETYALKTKYKKAEQHFTSCCLLWMENYQLNRDPRVTSVATRDP